MRNWKINLAASWVAQFLCIAGFNSAFPYIPFYIRELGITDLHQVELWAGLLASGAAISMAVVSPIWGVLADRYGRKLMVERAAFGGAIIMTAMAFATSVQQLFVLRILQGVFTGTIPAFVTLVASFVPTSEVGFSLGMMQVAVYAGSSVGPMIGGLVADHWGYRWAFAATGLLLFLAGLLVYAIVQENFVRPEKRRADKMFGAGMRTIFSSLPVLGAILTLGGIYMANSTPAPVLSLFVETLTPEASRINTITGSVYGVNAVASAIAAALIGRLSDRKGYRRILIACSLGAGLMYLAQGFSPSVMVLMAVSVATGFFTGGLLPTANSILARTAPADQQGIIYGISNSVNAVGRAVGPMLGAGAATALGLRGTFAVTAAIFGIVTGWTLLVSQRDSKELLERPSQSPTR